MWNRPKGWITRQLTHDDDGQDDIGREGSHRNHQLGQDHEAALDQKLEQHRNLVVH